MRMPLVFPVRSERFPVEFDVPNLSVLERSRFKFTDSLVYVSDPYVIRTGEQPVWRCLPIPG